MYLKRSYEKTLLLLLSIHLALTKIKTQYQYIIKRDFCIKIKMIIKNSRAIKPKYQLKS